MSTPALEAIAGGVPGGTGVTRVSSRTRRRQSLAWAAAAAVVAVGAVVWLGSGVTGESSDHRPAQAVTMAAPAPRPAIPLTSLQTGGLPTRVVVPSAGIDAPISEVGVVFENGQAVWETAWHAVGHHLDSALPGQPGNVVLTGHVSVADRRNLAAFAHLDSVKTGDIVELYSGDSSYRYRVDRISVVAPDALQVLRSSQASTVTLITCTHDLKHRLVVSGTLA